MTMFVLFSHKMPFYGKGDEGTDESTCKGVVVYKHGEPEDLQARAGVRTSGGLTGANGLFCDGMALLCLRFASSSCS